MAFRATSIVPADAYDKIRKQAVYIKNTADSFVDALGSGADFDQIRAIYTFLVAAKSQTASLAVTPGLAAYAAAQENDVAYDVAAEYTAMIAAIDAVTAWIDANSPATASVANPSTWANGSLLSTAFTSQQVAPLAGLLGTLSSRIA